MNLNSQQVTAMLDTTVQGVTQSRTQQDRNVPRGATVLLARARLQPVPPELSLMLPEIQQRVIVKTALQVHTVSHQALPK